MTAATLEPDAFLRAIGESPDDDAPRLVFADWLDEQGDHPRAEFIRAQCEAETLPEGHPRREALQSRIDELLHTHQHEWEAGIAEHPFETMYRRGFLDEISIEDEDWPRRLPRLAALQPPVRIAGILSAEIVAAISSRPELADVRRLSLAIVPPAETDTLARLLRSPHTPPLVELAIHHFGDPEGFWQCLAAWPGLAHIRTLDLPAVALRTVFASPHLVALRSLRVDELAVSGSDILRPLADWPGLGQLEQLELREPQDETLRPLSEAGRATNLRRLHLESDGLTPTPCLELLASPGLPRLRDLAIVRDDYFHEPSRVETLPTAIGTSEPLERLHISSFHLGDNGVGWLATLPRLAGLSVLELFDCGITAVGAHALADSPHLRALQSLTLRGNRLGAAGVRALACSPHLSGLQSLDLASTRPGVVGMRALTRAPWTRTLTRLDLSSHRFPASASRALATAPFESLQTVFLNGCNIDWGAFGESVWLGRVRELQLNFGTIGSDADLIALARSLGPDLRSLELQAGRFGVVGLRALLARPLSGLRRLDLDDTLIRTPGIRVLANWPGLANVRHLSLRDCGVGTVGVETLAASPHLDRQTRLFLRPDGVRGGAWAALQARVDAPIED